MRERVALPEPEVAGGFAGPSRVAVGAADDAREREADRLADAALRGVPVARPSREGAVLRREKSDTDKLKEAGEKSLEAGAETSLGKKALKGLKETPAVKFAKDTKAGMAITGGVAVGVIFALGLTGTSLPVQIPTIPWENWKLKVRWKGPLFDPTDAMVTLTYSFGGPSENDKARATPPKPAPDPLMQGIQQQAAGWPAPSPAPWLPPQIGQLGYRYKVPEQPPAPPPPGLRLTTPSLAEGMPKRRPMLQIDTPQLQLKDLPVLQRSATGDGPAFAPPETQRVLAAPGRALESATRGDMERRFGVDLSAIRIHDDAEGAAGARAVAARAWACGPHLAFAEGAYAPETPGGRRLLAHEIAHAVQQGAA